MTIAQGRDEARRLQRLVEGGTDPLGIRAASRAAETMADLWSLYEREHLPTKRAGSQQADRLLWGKHIQPVLGQTRMDQITHADVARLHRHVSEHAKIAANRTTMLLSKMFSLAVQHSMATSNPCKFVRKNAENRRDRYMSRDEIARLNEALAAHPLRQSAHIVTLLLLTGARRGEMLNARFTQFDLDAGTWTKGAHYTKQRKLHHVPLSPPALALVRELKRLTNGDNVFPGVGNAYARQRVAHQP